MALFQMSLNPVFRKKGLTTRLMKSILFLIWISAVCAGFSILLRYSNAPGKTQQAPKSWPAESRLAKPAELPVLIIALHPQCPCSRASVSELERMMAHLQGKVKVYALFAQPEGLAEDKVYSDTWKRAQKIPGVEVLLDEKGLEGRHFGAQVSGETFLYNTAGRLVFQGGITSARGHEGESAGAKSLTDFILKNQTAMAAAPVFGCPLQNVKTRKDL